MKHFFSVETEALYVYQLVCVITVRKHKINKPKIKKNNKKTKIQ